MTFDTLKDIYNVLWKLLASSGIRLYLYDFITEETGYLGKPSFQIPHFRFVESALAIEVSPDQKAAVFLVEEVIAEDQQGPFTIMYLLSDPQISSAR